MVACDIRGYTAFAEQWPSAQIIEGLEEYYDHIGRIAARYDATIKDYAGDGVLLLVGAPLHCADHAARATAMADTIMREVSARLATWCDDCEPLGMGIGVATGEATVGLVGGVRLEYAAVGSVVNRASRLCDAAPAGEILLDEATFTLAQQDAALQNSLQPHEALSLKGFDGLVPAWSFRTTGTAEWPKPA